MDNNTKIAAGDHLCEILTANHIPYQICVLNGDMIEPDEHYVGSVVMAYKNCCDGIIAVGSGVINDICKVVSNVGNCPQITVPTAPSMDGYASTCAAMLINGLKTSIYLPSPNAVVADVNILCNAPMRMIQAGLGDMITKFVSLPEWELANIVHDEYWCKQTSDLAKRSAEMCFDVASLLAQRDPRAIATLIEGLIISGICMCLVNVSGPASGGEHYVSHIWDMNNIAKGHKLELHGIQTGIGTLNMMYVYQKLRHVKLDQEKAKRFAHQFDRNKWESDMRHAFGKGADKAIQNEAFAGKHDIQKHELQLARIQQNWDDVQRIINSIPNADVAEKMWTDIGAPFSHRQIGRSDQELLEAFTYSPEIRDRYVGARLLWDIGLLEDAKDWLLERVNRF